MTNYSQSTEQEQILNFFGTTVKGTFLDLGCNDGITLSNTYALNLLGWSGVLVDASPKAYERLQKNMPFENDLIMVNAAISDFDGEVILHESGELLGSGDIALVSSTSIDETKRWSSLNMVFDKIKVPCITFKTLQEKVKHKKYDFISIDIEGNELCVLPQLDLKELGCKMICVEFNGKEQEKYGDIIVPQGYSLVHKNAENLIYTKDLK